MRTYQAKNSNGMGKRVRKAQGKARFVGFLYLLGALGLAGLTFLMPVLTFDGKPLGITSFFNPYLDLFGGKVDLLSVAIATLYLFVVLSVVFNALGCLGKLGDLTQNNSKQMGRYNKTMQAMDKMGRLFSGSFAAIVIFHFLIWMFVGEAGKVALTSGAYITLVFGIAIHFFAGLLHGKVHYFQVGGQIANVVEVKRECGLFVYFFRNLVQIAATAAILYFLAPNTLLNGAIKNVLAGQIVINDLLPAGLQALMVIFIIVLIKHATATTEFNLEGMDGKGMKNYRVFSFLTFLVAAGALALCFLQTKVLENYLLFVAGIAFVAFLVDCIFKTRPKKVKEEENEEEVEDPMLNPFAPVNPMAFTCPVQKSAPNMPMPQMPIIQMTVPTACPQETAKAQQRMKPVYVPTYYPMPTPYPMITPYPVMMPYPMPAPAPYAAAPAPYGATPAPAAAAPCAPEKKTRPAPAPAPSYLQPTPAPSYANVESKKELKKKRQELKDRAKELKRAKVEAKKYAKLAKKNLKKENKLRKKENRFAKKNTKQQNKIRKQEENFARKNAAVASEFLVATATQMPIPAPAPVAAPEKPVVEPPAKVENEITELPPSLDPNKEWKVRCPKCGKELLIRETSPYHRCPSCGKVFQIRKFETFVKKN